MLSLKNIYDQVNKHIDNIQVMDICAECDMSPPWLDTIRQTKYYWAVAAYCDLFKVKSVLEFGTCTGASALAMSKYAEHVTTVDITDQVLSADDPNYKLAQYPYASVASGSTRVLLPKVKDRSNISVVVLPEPKVFTVDTKGHDLIFVDVSHDGITEALFHRKILENGYHGIVFYDDIFMNKWMAQFWAEIPNEKLVAEDWHASGFGIVRY